MKEADQGNEALKAIRKLNSFIDVLEVGNSTKQQLDIIKGLEQSGKIDAAEAMIQAGLITDKSIVAIESKIARYYKSTQDEQFKAKS
jgi:hypothetical protein